MLVFVGNKIVIMFERFCKELVIGYLKFVCFLKRNLFRVSWNLGLMVFVFIF